MIVGGLWLFWASVGLGVVWGVASVVWSCDCGRRRRWYFGPLHEQGLVMLFPVVVEVAAVVGVLLVVGWSSDLVGLIGFLPPWAYWVRRWWVHERDKIRRAVRALGRVRVNEHGRLVVS